MRVLVVGDVMLDRYWWGNVERISPEAPVPVVKLQKTSLVVGGAANVAANVAGLGAQPILLGAIGCDNEGDFFKPLLNDLKISHENLVKIKNRPTTLKTRVVAHNQHVVRIDQETGEALDASAEKKVLRIIEKKLDEADIIIVSDYAKGFLTEKILTRLITTANEKNKVILVDPKGKNYRKYSGADILTPNRFEAAQICDLGSERKNVIEESGKMILKNFDLKSLLITQGENGMTLFRENQKSIHLDAQARNVYDVTGAGDTVIAALGVSLGGGANLPEAANIANIAAGIVVGEIGTTIITKEKLFNFFERSNLLE